MDNKLKIGKTYHTKTFVTKLPVEITILAARLILEEETAYTGIKLDLPEIQYDISFKHLQSGIADGRATYSERSLFENDPGILDNEVKNNNPLLFSVTVSNDNGKTFHPIISKVVPSGAKDSFTIGGLIFGYFHDAFNQEKHTELTRKQFIEQVVKTLESMENK